MRNDKQNVIVNLSFNFALDIIEFSELLEEKRKFVVTRQLLKSGTAVGASVWEALFKFLNFQIFKFSFF